MAKFAFNEPTVLLSPNSLTFPSTMVGQASSAQTVTFSAGGTDAVFDQLVYLCKLLLGKGLAEREKKVAGSRLLNGLDAVSLLDLQWNIGSPKVAGWPAKASAERV